MFSGGEGVGLGLSAAGLVHAWGVEYDADIAGVARMNGFDLIVDDVRNVDYSALPRVDWLHASPVCTRASNANPNAKESPEDLATADAVVRAVKAQGPQVFTLENVYPYRNFESFARICAALNDLGYMWDFEHVNAADFGVPQTRKRLILRAVRLGLLPPLPAPVRWVGWYDAIEDLIPELPESQLAPWQVARLPEELRTLLFSSNGNMDSFGDHHAEVGDPALSVTPQALGRSRAVLVESHNTLHTASTRDAHEPAITLTHSMTSRPSHLHAVLVKGDDNSGEFGVVTCAADAPAFTLRSGRSAEHRTLLFDPNNTSRDATIISENRPAMTVQAQHGRRPSSMPAGLLSSRVVSMTPRALARFQSFPDSYKLPDKRTLAAKVIGNAVPPKLMQGIAEGLIDGGAL